MRHRVQLPYNIEGWERAPRRWVKALGEIALWVGSIALGAGLAWLLMVLHAAGVTP